MIRERPDKHNFTFPWGGFGTIFTKKSIERFVDPTRNCPFHRRDPNENDGTIYALGDTDELLDPKSKTSLKTMHHRELTNDEFQLVVCSRLREDRIGEGHLFEEGMSVTDVMYKYVTNWKYVEAENNWKTDPNHLVPPKFKEIVKPGFHQLPKFIPGGFCFHADWAIGCFVNHYYWSSRTTAPAPAHFNNNPEDRLHSYRGSEHLSW